MSKKILVIDDESAILSSIRQASPPEYIVEYAPDGISGLDKVRTQQEYALIIVDLHMPEPGLDGQETIVSLRGLTNAPILMLTGYPNNQSSKLARELTGHPPLIKPITIPELAHYISMVLSQPPSPIDPAYGVYLLAQSLIDKKEYISRAQQSQILKGQTQQYNIIAAATSSLKLNGITGILLEAGIITTFTVPKISQLPLFMTSASKDTIVVTSPEDSVAVAALQCPMVCLTDDFLSAVEAYETIKQTVRNVPWGVIVENPRKILAVKQVIRDVIESIALGSTLIPLKISDPFLDLNISPQERNVLLCEVKGFETQETASFLRISPDYVRKLRARLSEKLETEDLGRWAIDWWFDNYP